VKTLRDMILMVLSLLTFMAGLLLFGALGCVRPDYGTAPLEQHNYNSPKLVDAEHPMFGEMMPQDLDNTELLAEYSYYMNGSGAAEVPHTVRGIRLTDIDQYRVYCRKRALILERHMRRRHLIK